jgi:ubiquinone/menaquinone biosynthesis C-methylase UbiE
VIDRAAAAVSLRNRRRKLRLFFELIQPTAETTVVDVGVADTAFGKGRGQALTHNFFEALYPWPERITAVSDGPLPHFAEAFPEMRSVVADGRDLPFADDEFDVGFSNAVVEHVGAHADQERFVRELCRVAKKVFVTTPNRLFPVDPHTLLPVVHWLPEGRRPRALDGVRPLSPRELRSLFPYPVRIVNTGLTLIAVGGRSPSEG